MPDKTILLIEDDPDDQVLTLKALRRNGIVNRAELARDGGEAIDYLFRGPKGRPAPILVLLDLHLPRIDGLEVLRRIREDQRTADVPVIILTSSRDEEDEARSTVLGASAYVRKPIVFEEFAAATRRLGIHWLLIDRAVAPDLFNHLHLGNGA